MAVVGTPVPNTPDICWYQRRHHVKLAKQDESRSEINADAVPCLGGGGPGDDEMALIAERNFGSSPGANWDIDITGYGVVWISWVGLTFVAGAGTGLRFSNDGGSSFRGLSGDYQRSFLSGTGSGEDGNQAQMYLAGVSGANGEFGSATILNPNSANIETAVQISGHNDASAQAQFSENFVTTKEVNDFIRIFGLSSNINGGVFRVTGLIEA